MHLPAVPARVPTTARPEARPKMTPAEKNAFLAAKHQALRDAALSWVA
jgi:hypothetical protein